MEARRLTGIPSNPFASENRDFMYRPLDLVLFTTLAAGVIACGSGPTAPFDAVPEGAIVVQEDSAVIGLGETVAFDGRGVAVRYVALVGDSRCPTGVTCVWEGDAEVRVSVFADGETTDVALHTRLEPGSVVVDGVTISLLDVLPYPVEGVSVDAAETSIVVRVSESG